MAGRAEFTNSESGGRGAGTWRAESSAPGAPNPRGRAEAGVTLLKLPSSAQASFRASHRPPSVPCLSPLTKTRRQCTLRLHP